MRVGKELIQLTDMLLPVFINGFTQRKSPLQAFFIPQYFHNTIIYNFR